MKFQLQGKIQSFTNHNGNFFTVITTPAPDSYSRPSTFKVRSPHVLAQPNTEVFLDCEISGYVKTKNYIKDGQQKHFDEPVVFIDAVIAAATPKQSPQPMSKAG